MIAIEVKIDKSAFDKISALTDKGLLMRSLEAGGFVIEAETKRNIDRQGLRDTGNLINSVRTAREGNAVTIGPRGIIYAAIHEFGGVIRPKVAKALHWISKTGEDIFAQLVTMPARPYLRPAVDENLSKISKAIGDTLADGIK